jgi:hypothetical protein
MLRHDLVSRRPTTTCQKEPEAFKEKIVDYFLFVEQQRRKFNYQHVYAADETAVYIDFSNSLTLETKGAKEVGFQFLTSLIEYLGSSKVDWSRKAPYYCHAYGSLGWFQVSTLCFAIENPP